MAIMKGFREYTLFVMDWTKGGWIAAVMRLLATFDELGADHQTSLLIVHRILEALANLLPLTVAIVCPQETQS